MISRQPQRLGGPSEPRRAILRLLETKQHHVAAPAKLLPLHQTKSHRCPRQGPSGPGGWVRPSRRGQGRVRTPTRRLGRRGLLFLIPMSWLSDLAIVLEYLKCWKLILVVPVPCFQDSAGSYP